MQWRVEVMNLIKVVNYRCKRTAQKLNNILNKSKKVKFFHNYLKKMQDAVIWFIFVHFMGGHSLFSVDG